MPQWRERFLREYKHRRKLLFSCSPVSVWDFDPDYLSSGYCRNPSVVDIYILRLCGSVCLSHYLSLGDPAETDYTAVGCAVTTISSNLTEMSKGVKLLAALMDDEGGNGQQLLGAAKNLACAVSDMLKTAQPANTEVDGKRPQAQLSLQVLYLDLLCVLFLAPSEPATGCRKCGPGQRRVTVPDRRDRHWSTVSGESSSV